MSHNVWNTYIFAADASTHVFVTLPNPSIATVTTSPCFNQTGGFRNAPTPLNERAKRERTQSVKRGQKREYYYDF
jgi:hypothetical protein